MSKKTTAFLLFITLLCGSVHAPLVRAESEDTPPPQETENDPVTLASIEITTPAEKLEYTVGEELTIAGLIVTGTYSDSGTAPLSISTANISGFNSTVPVVGQVLTITYEEFTATYRVDIVAPEEPGESGDTNDTTGDPTASVHVTVYVDQNVAAQGDIPLPEAGSVTLPTHNDGPQTVNAQSALALLAAFDTVSDTFTVSDLEHTFGFFINCITVPALADAPFCNDFASFPSTAWLYAVNGTAPFVGMGDAVLDEGDTLAVYYTDATSRRVSLTAASVETGTPFTARAEEYDPATGEYVPAAGLTIGVTQPNPDPENPFTPIEIATAHVDDTGEAAFTLATPGVYNVGIQEDFYFPTVELTVTAPAENEGGHGGSGGGSSAPEFSVPDAIAYLKSVQGEDGSLADSELYTDWAAIAFAAAGTGGNAKSSLLEYMSDVNSTSSLITDNERRAMALLALGENPYDWGGENYIAAILQEFDGEQFGDAGLVNDDIFALLPLQKTGYDEDDPEIQNAVEFILAEQKANGSWESSVDVTAAAVQALVLFDDVAGVSDALDRAETFLRSMEQSDGGWGDIFSTSWALQAANALGASWAVNGTSGLDYLAKKQTTAANGGAALPATDTLENAVWATSYAVPAALGKSWTDIMDSVSRPRVESESGGGKNSQEGSSETPTTTESNEAPTPVPAELPENPVVTTPIVTSPSPMPAPKPKTLTLPLPQAPETTEEEAGTDIPGDALAAAAITALPPQSSGFSYHYLFFALGGGAGLYLIYLFFKKIFGF